MNRLSIKKGMEKIFSKQALVEFIKTLVKSIVLVFVVALLFKNNTKEIKTWTSLTISRTLSITEGLILKIFILLIILFFVISAGDYLYQYFQFMKKMKMTKQEVKDEHKETEGDPEIKQRIRRLRQERANNKMMANLPNATVVITNPTHFSVALQFNEETLDAPRVIAKGQDHMALLIRKIAKSHDIPIIENPPIARDLFARVDINQEIPEDSYKAVAEIIRFVLKLKNQPF